MWFELQDAGRTGGARLRLTARMERGVRGENLGSAGGFQAGYHGNGTFPRPRLTLGGSAD
jgi:hypothetical protein